MMENICQRLLMGLMLVVLAVPLLGCGSPADSNTKPAEQTIKQEVQEVSMEEAMTAWRSKTAEFIDVRTPEEFKEGHVPGAILLPLAELENRLTEIPKDKKVMLICRSGNRSAKANLTLQKHGYMNTVSVKGGMTEWREDIEK